MAKPDLGKKRTCLSCGARFYDLNRTPITCPKCETVLDVTASSRPSRARAAPEPKAAKPKAAKVEAEVVDDDDIEDDDSDEEEEDDGMIEDASELGEDKDDMFEVMDGVEENKKVEDV